MWEKTYAVQGAWAFTATKDGNYILGRKDFAKVSPMGDVLWIKRYWGLDNITPWYYYLDVIATSDGGYLATGFYEMNTFLVKTDCNGNLEWDTRSCLLQTDKEVLVFPNPFIDYVTFQLPNVNLDTDKVTLSLTNSLGQIVFSGSYSNQNIITLNTSTISEALYIYSITVNGAFYYSGKIIKQSN